MDTSITRTDPAAFAADIEGALRNFKSAAQHLLEVWERGPDDALAAYPAYMPAFEEFVADISAMTVQVEQPAQRYEPTGMQVRLGSLVRPRPGVTKTIVASAVAGWRAGDEGDHVAKVWALTPDRVACSVPLDCPWVPRGWAFTAGRGAEHIVFQTDYSDLQVVAPA